MKLDISQENAVDMAINSRFHVINGGAGCGKTSIITEIVNSLDDDVLLCAFAGKAAARMREATGHDAMTIHRMLEWKGEGLGFTRKSLAGYTVIIDEASMIPADLMAEITKRNPSRLILVGDEAQLPPVGNGQPFHDIVKMMPWRVSTLMKCYRNNEAIFEAASAVRNGNVPAKRTETANELWEFANVNYAEEAHDIILNAVSSGNVDFGTDIILACRNGEDDKPCTVETLNRDIKCIVNPASANDTRPKSRQLDIGDRVICTVNTPALDVWNGTTGRIEDYATNGDMWVRLDFPAHGKYGDTYEVCIAKRDIINWSLAYALTVHKAQGSQYRRVYFTCLWRDSQTLLDRSMVYTAMTRAKAECHFVGEFTAFKQAVNNARPKHTVLQELINKGMK